MAAPRLAGNLSPDEHIAAGKVWVSRIGTERPLNDRGFAESGLRHLLPAAQALARSGKYDDAAGALLPAVQTIRDRHVIVDVNLLNQVRQIARDLSGKGSSKARVLASAAR